MPYLQLVLAGLGLRGWVEEINGENLVIDVLALCSWENTTEVVGRYPRASSALKMAIERHSPLECFFQALLATAGFQKG